MYFISHLRKLLNLFDEFVIDALRLAIDSNDNKESIEMSITKSPGAPHTAPRIILYTFAM